MTRCPICKTPVEPPKDSSERSFYPFCSERCKLIDLGRWLDGRYQIPVDQSEQDESEPRDTLDNE